MSQKEYNALRAELLARVASGKATVAEISKLSTMLANDPAVKAVRTQYVREVKDARNAAFGAISRDEAFDSMLRNVANIGREAALTALSQGNGEVAGSCSLADKQVLPGIHLKVMLIRQGEPQKDTTGKVVDTKWIDGRTVRDFASQEADGDDSGETLEEETAQ